MRRGGRCLYHDGEDALLLPADRVAEHLAGEGTLFDVDDLPVRPEGGGAGGRDSKVAFVSAYRAVDHECIVLAVHEELGTIAHRAGELAVDERRRERLADAPPREVFARRRSRLLPFLVRELVVDREERAVYERRFGRLREIRSLEGVLEADVRGFSIGDPQAPRFRVVVRFGEAREERDLGSEEWPMRTAIRIAESVNDALDLPESRRKFLRYRRVAPEDGGDR